MESYELPNFMILGTKNAFGGLKTDIGGPCPKPYINITFWGDFFSPGGGKTILEWKIAIWEQILIFFLFWSNPCGPGRLRNLDIPIGISRFPAPAVQGPLRIMKSQFWSLTSPNFLNFHKISWNFTKIHEISVFGVPGGEWGGCNHWKSIGITVLFACQRCGAEILRNA